MPAHPNLRFLLSSPSACLALGFGAGLSPWAPGTAGSLVAFPLSWALHPLPLMWQLAVWSGFCLAGLWICQRAGKALGNPDHPAIVWDEICAMGLVLLAVPAGIAWMAAAFVAFRLFDVVKPWPINIVDRTMPNAIGVMGDDLLAALYAVVLLVAAQATLI